jgi:Ca2+-dependent lipid-binding protein
MDADNPLPTLISPSPIPTPTIQPSQPPPKPIYTEPSHPTVQAVRGNCGSKDRNSEIIKMVANRILDMVMMEISKDEMKDNIKKKIVNPLMYIIYTQLCPYIYTFVTIILLMFVILIVILIFFIIYLKK